MYSANNVTQFNADKKTNAKLPYEVWAQKSPLCQTVTKYFLWLVFNSEAAKWKQLSDRAVEHYIKNILRIEGGGEPIVWKKPSEYDEGEHYLHKILPLEEGGEPIVRKRKASNNDESLEKRLKRKN